MDGGLMAVAVLCIAFAVYFAPGFIAEARGRDGSGTIVVLNLLLGWTVLGWLVLLVVAFTGRSARDRAQQDEQIHLMRQMLAQQQAAASPQSPSPPVSAQPAELPIEDNRTLAQIMDAQGAKP